MTEPRMPKYPPKSHTRRRWSTMVHVATGETALVQPMVDGLCAAQFDRLDHPEAYGWHLHLRREFRPLRGVRWVWEPYGHWSPAARSRSKSDAPRMVQLLSRGSHTPTSGPGPGPTTPPPPLDK